MAAATTLPVTIIGGYLGAGKTTLVNHLLRHSGGRRIAVAVNEFGALSIDHDLIEGADGEVLTLAGGCICCTFGSDLVAALMELAERAGSIDHILIEASGVALPGAIAQSLSLVAGLTLDAIVVMVDAETIRALASDLYMGDTILRQLACADIVVVNKIDLISGVEFAAHQAWLPMVAASARVVAAEHGVVPAELILGFDGAPAVQDGRLAEGRHLQAALASESLTFDYAVDVQRLATALADTATGLVRAKGIARDHDGGWMTLQIVGQRCTIAPAPTTETTAGRLVCIAHGRRLDRDRIQALIKACGRP